MNSPKDKLRELKRRLGLVGRDENNKHEHDSTNEMLASFSEKLGDDLNISGALGELFTWVNEIFVSLDDDSIDFDNAQKAIQALDDIDQILGVLEIKHSEDEENIQNLINQRNQARDEKKWDEADLIRKQLDEMNIVLEDTPDGTIWKKK